MKHNVTVSYSTTGQIESKDLAVAVLREAWELAGRPETADLEPFTDTAGNTYLGDDTAWRVSNDPRVATLVQAWAIRLGRKPKVWNQAQVNLDRVRLTTAGIPVDDAGERVVHGAFHR